MSLYTRKDNIIEDYHGVKVADPYRWLEDPNSPETKQWITEQNKHTNDYLKSYPERDQIKRNLTELMNYRKYSLPQKEGNYYYYHKNDGLQNQAVFYRAKSLNQVEEEVIIDPNKLYEKGTAAITNTTFNQDGSLMAYAISYDGSDWQEFKIRDLETGTDYPEVLKWCKFTNISWSENNQGFFYNRYPSADADSVQDNSYYNKVYWHEVGTPQETDKLIYEDSNKKEFSFVPKVSDDNQYLILTVHNGTEPLSSLYYRKLNSNDEFTPLINDRQANYTFLGNEGNVFYIQTNYDAPKGKVCAVNLDRPEKEHWQEVIPEKDDAISFIKIINNHFVVSAMQHAADHLTIYDMEGTFQKEIPLPKHITIANVTGEKTGAEMFIHYSSFLESPKVVRYNFENNQLESIFSSDQDLPITEYETNQVIYTSKDGTKIPMFLTHKKGLELSGNHPVLLYGYGGYNISMTPSFSPSQMMWIQAGGIYAVANIRGGGEFGEKWHTAGILDNKQNSFDDFIAASEWLIEQGYTNSKKLAIMGGSNGGLLVGACITQRPELFGAALCLVPVTDMLRFHRFTVGRFWTTEFGNAETNPNHFKFMYEYSPLHNVQEGVTYPPTLITTADTDDRVVPLHAKKFAATLQEKQMDKNPTFLRVERNAGHGLGKPISKIIEEQTDLYTFLFKELNV